MQIQFFGQLGERIARQIDFAVPADGCSVAELRKALAAAYPEAADALTRRSVRACIDETIVPETQTVRADSRVAFFPPLSGG